MFVKMGSSSQGVEFKHNVIETTTCKWKNMEK